MQVVELFLRFEVVGEFGDQVLPRKYFVAVLANYHILVQSIFSSSFDLLDLLKFCLQLLLWVSLGLYNSRSSPCVPSFHCFGFLWEFALILLGFLSLKLSSVLHYVKVVK